ncbi:MAG: acyltransferase [Bacteroidales bacterium]|nr:acyltransferase [Bacteroidales bacterium]MBR1799452.1 acyltransferase [Bacteroidales bacterium]
MGKHVHIGPNVTIDYPFPYFVTIEDGASLAGGNYILAHSTPLEYHQRCTESFVAPVVVHRNAWIGVNAILMPGIEVGEGAIVGAGAVVTQNVPPNTMVAGVPARTIKTFEP